MANRTRALADARRAWERTAHDIGDELLTSRRMLGATQNTLATALGISTSEVSRRERGRAGTLNCSKLALHAAAVGLRLSLKLYPTGGGVRDAAQAAYVARFVSRVGSVWNVRLEEPIPRLADLRAVDIVLRQGEVTIAVEVVTRLADLQAQVRSAQLKARDLGATRLIVAVAGTHANRRALSSVSSTLVAAFDLDSRRLMSELKAGRDPGRDGVVLL